MNELHHIWFTYFWPSLQGNGPEDLFHLALLGAAGWLATRVGKRIVAEWREHKAKVEAHHALLQKKVDNIIEHHPDIPPFEES